MFDVSTYTDSSFNVAEFSVYIQSAQILLMSQFEDCKTTNFLFSLDNRLSDSAFLSGTLAQIGTQLTTAGGYLTLSLTLTSGSTMQVIFNDLW